MEVLPKVGGWYVAELEGSWSRCPAWPHCGPGLHPQSGSVP